MVTLLNTRLVRPVEALGNPEDPRETDPDAEQTTAMALWRGMLYEAQSAELSAEVDNTPSAPGSQVVTVVGGMADEAAPSLLSEDRVGAARITLARAWHVNLRDASGNSISLGAGTAGTTTLRTVSADDDLVAATTRLGNTAASSGHRLMVIGAFRDDVGATTVSEGAYSAFRCDAYRALHVTLQGNQVILVNRSGTIASGGVAQTLSGATSTRRGFFVQNLSTGDLWIYALGTATQGQPSIRIPPNAMYEAPHSGVPTATISIIGATTGQAFTAQEW